MASGISLAQKRGNWMQILDEQSEDYYYYNKGSGEVTWDVPADWDSTSVEDTLSSPMHNQNDMDSHAEVGQEMGESQRGVGEKAVVDLLTGDTPWSNDSVASSDYVRETSVSEFGMSGKSAAMLTQNPKQQVSETIPEGGVGSNPFGNGDDDDDDHDERATAATEKKDESVKKGGNPFQEDSFEKPPESPPKPPKPAKNLPLKPPKPPKAKREVESKNPFGDDPADDGGHTNTTVEQTTVETTEGRQSEYGRVVRDDEYTISKKGPKPSDFLAFDDSLPPPPPPTRKSMMGRESQMEARFRQSHDLVHSGYLESMERMGFGRYNAQVELMHALEMQEKEERENEGKEPSMFWGRKKKLTAKQMAVAALCSHLKEKPLYYDKTLWAQTIFGRVSSWLPDVEDPETGELHTFYIVTVTVRYNHHAAITWKLNRRMRHFQTLWNKISGAVSSALSPGSMEHPFPSTMGGWMKRNTDKDKNKRMISLTNFLEEILATSILVANYDIHEAVAEFLEIDRYVAEKLSVGQQKKQQVGQPGMSKRASKPTPAASAANRNGASQGNPFD